MGPLMLLLPPLVVLPGGSGPSIYHILARPCWRGEALGLCLEGDAMCRPRAAFPWMLSCRLRLLLPSPLACSDFFPLGRDAG